MKAFFFGLAVVILVGGCASGPQFHQADAAPNDKATVYVYRPKQIIGWGGLIPVNSPNEIYLNGTNRIELLQGGYCVYYVLAGTNFFSSELVSPDWMLNAAFKRDRLFQTNFEAARVYYLKFEVGAVSPKLKMMDSQIGQTEIQKCKLELPQN